MALDLSMLQSILPLGLSALTGQSSLTPQSSDAGDAPLLANANGTPGQSFSQPGNPLTNQVNMQQLQRLLQQQQLQQQQQQLQQQQQQRQMTQAAPSPQMYNGRQITPINWGTG